MYRLVRSMRFQSAKNVEVRQWAKATADMLNEKYPGHAVEAHAEVFGDLRAIHWTLTYADLAEVETLSRKLAADEAYQALVRKGWDYMIEGTLHDMLLGSI
jgi:hypothetical protein